MDASDNQASHSLAPQKVSVYATPSRGLLVFEEPEFPEVGVQVSGGTVEPGEDVLAAARRELHEETGLLVEAPLEHLLTVEHEVGRDGATLTHRRDYVRVRLAGSLPESWAHMERTPSGGGAPILFRLFWLPLPEARARLDMVLGCGLDRL